MEKEVLLRLLNSIDNNGDKEANHSTADSLLLRYIDDAEITKAYTRIKKWYA